jgi:hypothetical protein
MPTPEDITDHLARFARPAPRSRSSGLAEFESTNKSGKELLKHRAPLAGTRGECLDIVAGITATAVGLQAGTLQCPRIT